MRIGTELWQFAERAHPVYERAPTETRWPAPLEGFRPRAYVPWMVSERVPTREPMRMEMVGHPSVDLYRKGADGSTVQTVELYSVRASQITPDDLAPIHQLARQWYELLRSLSLGPYSQETLREMGYPYGYGARPSAPSWAKVKTGMPRGYQSLFKRGWAMRGVRGFVPPLSVINIQSGRLHRSWHWTITQWYGGLVLTFWNLAPYAWYLAHGTIKMRAHGPWNVVAERLLPAIHQAWRNAAQAAARRDRAMMAQFGEGYDAGNNP